MAHHPQMTGSPSDTNAITSSIAVRPPPDAVNTVAPGFLRTSPDYEPQWEGWGAEGQKQFLERIAMRRMGTPQDIAHAVMILASDYASWITGQILPVMGSPT